MAGITVKRYIESINKTNLSEKEKNKRIRKAAKLLTSSYGRYCKQNQSIRKNISIKIFFKKIYHYNE